MLGIIIIEYLIKSVLKLSRITACDISQKNVKSALEIISNILTIIVKKTAYLNINRLPYPVAISFPKNEMGQGNKMEKMTHFFGMFNQVEGLETLLK